LQAFPSVGGFPAHGVQDTLTGSSYFLGEGLGEFGIFLRGAHDDQHPCPGWRLPGYLRSQGLASGPAGRMLLGHRHDAEEKAHPEQDEEHAEA
jgi:hypothetical protein